MDEAISRAAIYICQLYSADCRPAYDPYSPNIIGLALGVLALGLVVLSVQQVRED